MLKPGGGHFSGGDGGVVIGACPTKAPNILKYIIRAAS